MIVGSVGSDGVPVVTIELDGTIWEATIDTGFNGDLELPKDLRGALKPYYVGRTRFLLAAGQTAEEDTYLVEFPFDGTIVVAEATFTDGPGILVGTKMLRQHRLDIHFPSRSVLLERCAAG